MPILTLDQLIAAEPHHFWPTPRMPGYEDPRETSAYKGRNPSRPTHNGSDIMYPAKATDPKHRCESGCTTPIDTPIVACSYGYVQKTRAWVKGQNSGGYVYLNIFTSGEPSDSTGWRNRYHHLSEVVVRVGDWVKPGDTLGWIRDLAPSSVPHLHLELLKYNRYEYEDPMPLLKEADLWELEQPTSPLRDRVLLAFDRGVERLRKQIAEEVG
jgi:hypothetical protein